MLPFRSISGLNEPTLWQDSLYCLKEREANHLLPFQRQPFSVRMSRNAGREGGRVKPTNQPPPPPHRIHPTANAGPVVTSTSLGDSSGTTGPKHCRRFLRARPGFACGGVRRYSAEPGKAGGGGGRERIRAHHLSFLCSSWGSGSSSWAAALRELSGAGLRGHRWAAAAAGAARGPQRR